MTVSFESKDAVGRPTLSQQMASLSSEDSMLLNNLLHSFWSKSVYNALTVTLRISKHITVRLSRNVYWTVFASIVIVKAFVDE